MEIDIWDIIRISISQGMKRYRNNYIWTMLSKVISKVVHFCYVVTHRWRLFPTLTNILSSKIIICWLTVQKLYLKMCIFGISRPIGGAVPNFGIYSQVIVSMKRTKLCVDWSNFGRDTASETIVGRRRRPSQHHNFFFQLDVQNDLFSHFCAAQSEDHLSQVWEEFDRFWRRSSENTVFHLLQNGWQTPCWKMTNETSSESAQPRERNNIRMMHFGQHFQKFKRFKSAFARIVIALEH